MTAPLLGTRIVNTRAIHQAAELDQLLRAHGAIPLSYPCLAIAPPEDPAVLDAALDDLLAGRFEWLVLTSANTVISLAYRLAAVRRRIPTPVPFRVATVGTTTARQAETLLGLHPSFVPTAGHGDALAGELPLTLGQHLLMPVSEIARPEPAAMLRARGADVTSVIAYRTAIGSGGIDLPRQLRRGEVEALTFTSPSAVTGCLSRFNAEGGGMHDLFEIAVVTLGPSTHEAARTRGFTQAVMASSPSLPDLIDALTSIFTNRDHKGDDAWLSRSSA